MRWVYGVWVAVALLPGVATPRGDVGLYATRGDVRGEREVNEGVAEARRGEARSRVAARCASGGSDGSCLGGGGSRMTG